MRVRHKPLKNKREKVYFLMMVILATGLLASATTSAASKDDFFQDALIRISDGDMEGAILQLKNVVQADPRFLPGWIRLSETYLMVAHGPAAEKAIKKAQVLGADPEFTILPLARSYLLQGKVEDLIALEPPPRLAPASHAELFTVQANALLESHRLDEARVLYEQAAVLSPNAIDNLLGRAMVEIRAGRPELAGSLLETALQRAPESAEVWYINAELRRNQGNLGDALLHFDEAIERRPEHVPARLGRAAVLMDLGRDAEASADLAQALAADPENLQALYLEAKLQLRGGNEAAANETLAAATAIMNSLPPDILANHLPSLMVTAVLAMRSENFERAKIYLERYLGRFPGHWGARKMLVAVYLKLGAAASARPILMKMMEETPEDPQLQWLTGTVYADMGWHGKAIKAFKQAQALGFTSSDLHMQLGTSLLAKGDQQGALKAFEQAAGAGSDVLQAKLMSYYLHLNQNDPVKALAVAEDLLAAEPKNAAYHNLAAALKLVLGRRKAAREQFNQAIILNPDFLPPRLNLAEMSRQTGDLDDAMEQYTAILESDTQAVGAMRGLAEIAVQQEKSEVAIRWLERLTEIDKKAVGDRVSLVKLYLVRNDVVAAKQELRKLRQNHPFRLDVLVLLAQVEYASSNTAAARDAFADASRLSQGSASRLRQVAKSQAALGFDKDAIRNLNRARVLAPENPRVLAEIARLKVRTGRLDEAEVHAEDLIGDYPEKIEGYQIRGEVYARGGRHDAAIAEFKRILAMNGTTSNVIRLANAYTAAGKIADGIDTVRGWLERHPDDIKADAVLGLLLMQDEQLAESIRVYETVRDADPRNVAANNNLAVLYDRTGDARAVLQARRTLSLHPSSAAILDTVGWILSKNGYVNEGLSYLREAYLRDASEPIIKFHLAQVLAGQGKIGEARELLTDALDNPEFEFRVNAEKLLNELTDS